MTQNNNVNVLAFYDSLDRQNHKKWWVDNVFGLVTAKNRLPPFQIVKPKTGNIVTKLDLINYDTGQVIPMRNEMANKGLNVVTNSEWNYDLVVCPSSLDLDQEYHGRFYLKLGDSINFFYSDVFTFCDVSDMIEIEYWHCEDFIYPGGHFQYNFPYKNRIYISSDIGKPSYEYEEVVRKRDGHNFHIQQISYKLNRFEFLCPEFVIDAMRLIRLHDQIIIKYQNQEFEVDELLMNNPRWQDKGDLASVLIEFKTDSVVVSNGRAVVDCNYEAVLGSCMITDLTAKASISSLSDDYTNFTYDDIDGVQQNMEDGQLFLVQTPSSLVLQAYGNSAYTTIPPTQDNILFVENIDTYYWVDASTYNRPQITGMNGLNAVGKSYPNSVIKVYGRGPTNVEYLVGSGYSNVDFDFDVPLEFPNGVLIDEIKVHTLNYICGDFDQTQWFELPFAGVGAGAIGSTFAIN